MISGIEELEKAVTRLYNSEMGEQRAPINVVSQYSDSIGEKFEGVNNSLTSGWETISDFFGEIDKALNNDINYIYNAVQNYIEQTKAIEGAEKKNLEEHEDSAEGILDRLGL